MMMTQPQQPDPRVIAMITHCLDHGLYEPGIQLALVQCFAAVFGQTPWWREMLDQDPQIAQLVKHAQRRVLH